MPNIDQTNRDLPPLRGCTTPGTSTTCGLNFVCDMHGRKSHEIVAKAIGALCNLEHRGARGADINTGDGAGILIQVPDRFFRDVVAFDLPEAGAYATGMAFLPQEPSVADAAAGEVERILEAEGLQVLGWREVPIDESILGTASLMTMPIFRQVFVLAQNGATGIDLDRLAFIARKRIEREIAVDAGPGTANEAMGGVSETHQGVYMPSLSARTFVYKGMLTTPQVAAFTPTWSMSASKCHGLGALAVLDQHLPVVAAAHPYRIVAHNGEINTIQGNRNWMRAREALLDSPHLPGLERAFPICTPGASDTAGFDEALELLSLGGYSLAEAVLMMIPEPWEHHDEMDADRKAFYQYNATRMEPWDGPHPSPSPTAPSWAPFSTGTASDRAATGSPRTASSSWHPKSASSISPRTPSSKRAGSSPAECS